MVYITSDLFDAATTRTQQPSPGSCRLGSSLAASEAGLGKRKRHAQDAAPRERSGNPSYAVFAMASLPERRPVKQIKRCPPKIGLVQTASHLMDVEVGLSTHTQPHTQPSAAPPIASDLRPCHACKLAPKRKRHLENYLDCKRCHERACYICARQCVGACGQAICKKCIVEVGHEGDSWCLDCYSNNINQ